MPALSRKMSPGDFLVDVIGCVVARRMNDEKKLWQILVCAVFMHRRWGPKVQLK
jgi:NAD(P)H-hydrate repair Nnr-like enzyme with NAD(P)H-hydrate dehydratase domain